MDCGLPGSSVHGILQAGVLEWVDMPSSSVQGEGLAMAEPAQRLVWAAKQPLGKAALGALFA